MATGKTQQIIDRDTAPRFLLNALLKYSGSHEMQRNARTSPSRSWKTCCRSSKRPRKVLGNRDYIALALALEARAIDGRGDVWSVVLPLKAARSQ